MRCFNVQPGETKSQQRLIPVLSPLSLNSVSRIQDSVNLVDDTVVGENINFHSPGIVEEDSGVADSDLDSSALKSVDHETVTQFGRDKDTREDVVEKDVGQSSRS